MAQPGMAQFEDFYVAVPKAGHRWVDVKTASGADRALTQIAERPVRSTIPLSDPALFLDLCDINPDEPDQQKLETDICKFADLFAKGVTMLPHDALFWVA